MPTKAQHSTTLRSFFSSPPENMYGNEDQTNIAANTAEHLPAATPGSGGLPSTRPPRRPASRGEPSSPGHITRPSPGTPTTIDLEIGQRSFPPPSPTQAQGSTSSMQQKSRQLAAHTGALAYRTGAACRNGLQKCGEEIASQSRNAAQSVHEKLFAGMNHTSQSLMIAADSIRTIAQDLLLDRLPSRSALGAYAGHSLQQLATCGIPTFAREVTMLNIYRLLANSKFARENPFAIVGMQSVVSMMAILAHAKVRQPRMRRDQIAAVKGHFGLSDAQWDALPEAEKTEKMAIQRADSRRVSANQVIAEGGFLTMTSLAAANGDCTIPSQVLATQLRNIVYAGMRELMQASVKLVATRGPSTSGVNDQNMSSMATAYSLTTLLSISSANLAAESIKSSIELRIPGHTSEFGEFAAIAAVRAVFNSAVEVVDAALAKHYETKQVGGEQIFNVGDKLPMTDHDRVLDHSIARFSWNQLAGMINLAMQNVAMSSNLAAQNASASNFLYATSTAASYGLSYRNTNQTYQAHARVRSAVAAQRQGAALEAIVTTPEAVAPSSGQWARSQPDQTPAAEIQEIGSSSTTISE
ncbi:Hypothetical Protein NBC2815_01526 [Xanthomonas fragariae]|nr:Hypothetical Protein NBC2815_01526 [Xanthomonas fragariae]